MTTPRIEETIESEFSEKFANKTVSGTDHHEMLMFIRTALTEAHQAGIDEAVEIIKKQTRYNMESDGACSDPECCGYPAYDMWESDDGEYLKRDDTIKALQDNK